MPDVGLSQGPLSAYMRMGGQADLGPLRATVAIRRLRVRHRSAMIVA